MKIDSRKSAFTLIELLAVIVIIVLLAAMLSPIDGHHRAYNAAHNAECLSNQRQIAVAYLMLSEDSPGEFPAQTHTLTNDSAGSIAGGYASLQFRSFSSYMHSPNIYVCPRDQAKHIAENITNLCDENVSYFINIDATTNNPSHSILTGDRNLQADEQPVKPGLFDLTTNLDMSWTAEIHIHGGILSFTDSHAEFVQSNALNSVCREQPCALNRLCVP